MWRASSALPTYLSLVNLQPLHSAFSLLQSLLLSSPVPVIFISFSLPSSFPPCLPASLYPLSILHFYSHNSPRSFLFSLSSSRFFPLYLLLCCLLCLFLRISQSFSCLSPPLSPFRSIDRGVRLQPCSSLPAAMSSGPASGTSIEPPSTQPTSPAPARSGVTMR